jgi:hypothetical protein
MIGFEFAFTVGGGRGLNRIMGLKDTPESQAEKDKIEGGKRCTATSADISAFRLMPQLTRTRDAAD